MLGDKGATGPPAALPANQIIRGIDGPAFWQPAPGGYDIYKENEIRLKPAGVTKVTDFGAVLC